MTDIRVTGLSELQAFLDQLPSKIEANIMRGALRAAAKPIKDGAKSLAPVGEPVDTNKRRYKLYAGALKDSIRISGRIDKRDGKITAAVKAGGKTKGADVFYAHFIEFGTRPRENNAGVSSRPFMRPALDGQATNAIIAAGEYIKKRLATKHGLNTAEIEIGIEE